MSAAGADSANVNSNSIIFTLKDTKLYVPVVTYQQKTIKNYPNFSNKGFENYPSKGFQRPAYWSEYKTTSENKNTANEYRYFLESNFVGVNRLFVLVYSNQDIIYQKSLLIIMIASSMEKILMRTN